MRSDTPLVLHGGMHGGWFAWTFSGYFESIGRFQQLFEYPYSSALIGSSITVSGDCFVSISLPSSQLDRYNVRKVACPPLNISHLQ